MHADLATDLEMLLYIAPLLVMKKECNILKTPVSHLHSRCQAACLGSDDRLPRYQGQGSRVKAQAYVFETRLKAMN